MEQPQTFELAVKQSGDRLDRYLASRLELSRSRLQKLIEEGQIWLNEGVCQQKKTILTAGDRLKIEIPPVVASWLEPESIPLNVLYEDEHLIVINKPAGMVVHPAPGHHSGTLVNALLHHCPDLAGVGGVQRPGIVHRLDKDTTGAMVVAKTEFALQHLQAQIKSKQARREYWAVVYGAPAAEAGTVDQPIGRHPVDRQRMAVVPPDKGRRAVTHWRILERLGNYTLMQFLLETGRTHQIRVHSSFMAHPVVGDPLYSSGRSVGVNLTGQALHARQLTLVHPVSGDLIRAVAPLPLDFQKLLKVLQTKMNSWIWL